MLCVGYLGERIEAALGDGARYGLELRYRYDPPDLAGRRARCGPRWTTSASASSCSTATPTCGSTTRAVERASRGHVALMTVLENGGRWDASNARFADGRVFYDKRAPDAGHALDRLRALRAHARGAARARRPTSPTSSTACRSRAGSAGYLATERFYEIGTAQGLAETDAFLSERASSAAARSSPP